MIDIILKISGVIIVLNVIILLVPYGKFEKYISLITGLLVVMVVLSCFNDINFDIDLGISESAIDYDSTDLVNQLNRDVELDLEHKYLAHTKFKDSIISIDVKADGEIKQVTLNLLSHKNKEEIINEVSAFYDIKKAFVMIE